MSSHDGHSTIKPTQEPKFMKYHYFEDDMDNMPIITLEVMQDSTATLPEPVLEDTFYNGPQPAVEQTDTKETTGVHFLTEKIDEPKEQDNSEALRVRNDLLEYTTCNDGSVGCKRCGKVLSSRQHWYRHKYKAHLANTVNRTVNPTSIFECKLCSIYFKSRKGYIGHIASKHSETLQDASPVLTNAQAEALAKEKEKQASVPIQPDVKKEPDPEMAIPKTIVPTYQAPIKQTKLTETSNKKTTRRVPEQTNDKDWEEERSREEKLVADIIARVKKECETQGPGPARRGYSRKSAIMRT